VSNIWILARMTFREAIRRRIVLTGLLLGLCFLVLFSLGFHFIIFAGQPLGKPSQPPTRPTRI